MDCRRRRHPGRPGHQGPRRRLRHRRLLRVRGRARRRCTRRRRDAPTGSPTRVAASPPATSASSSWSSCRGPTASFDVVTGFNAFQYALDVELALTRGAAGSPGRRPRGDLQVRAAGGQRVLRVPRRARAARPAAGAIGCPPATPSSGRSTASALDVTTTGHVLSTMALPDDDALAAALSSAGAVIGSPEHVLTAAAPYRQAAAATGSRTA